MKRGTIKQETVVELDLTQEQKDMMKEHFLSIDRLNSGYISLSELKDLFVAVGESVTEDRMNQVTLMIEERAIKKIDLMAAMRAWNYLRDLTVEDDDDDDNDVLHAFMAMGGNSDKTGSVKKQVLVDIITVQFGLTVNIDEMLEEAELDIDDELSYADFMALFGGNGSQRTSRIISLFSVASFA